jgi:hypothetical protein
MGIRTHRWNQISSGWESISVCIDFFLHSLGEAILHASTSRDTPLDVSSLSHRLHPSSTIKVSEAKLPSSEVFRNEKSTHQSKRSRGNKMNSQSHPGFCFLITFKWNYHHIYPPNLCICFVTQKPS